jgi:sugar/nucleoside kinase (ribokinase family)
MHSVFGIGNPLIDVVFSATYQDLKDLSLDKGIMHLVSQERQEEILRHFHGQSPVYHPGGSAPNTLLALTGLGVPGVIAGKIGQDHFGNTYEEQVQSYGITSRLIQGDGPTGSSIILVTPDGERTMNTHLGMCQEFSRDDLDEDLLRVTVKNSGLLYFTGYMWDTETQKGAILRAIEITLEVGGRVVFDLADPFAVERYREDFLTLLRDTVDIVFANRREAAILLQEEHDPTTTLALLNELVPVVALKTGKEGSLIGAADGNTVIPIPATAIKPLDTTGAGDMYAAGFLTGLATDQSLERCGTIAGILAEEIIQRRGAQFDIATIRSLQAEIQDLRDPS